MHFTKLVDLASERVGGSVLYANDEFFAPKENLLKASSPIFIEGKYTEYGKWMDGWESRRKRAPNLHELYDWCTVRLGLPGRIHGVIVDTSFFKGNYPTHCSIEGCLVKENTNLTQLISEATRWVEILPKSPLQGDSRNAFEINPTERLTHLKLKIYPDGGVARLRVHGEVLPDWDRLISRDSEVDLAAVENGGAVIACSDMFFGHRHNLIMPGRALNMSDGWETKRRRGPGHDWSVIQLGKPGTIERLEVDTSWFKGNFPDSCSLEACVNHSPELQDFSALDWKEVLPQIKLQAHTRHCFEDEIIDVGTVTHVRFNIYPDGGVSRLRVFGRVKR